MIFHRGKYLKWIEQNGVGSNDRVASSPGSYISYLSSVSRLIHADISPKVLSTEGDISRIVQQIGDKRSDKTKKNYVSAMRQYVNMISAGAF